MAGLSARTIEFVRHQKSGSVFSIAFSRPRRLIQASSSNRLRELAERMSTPAYLIDGAEDMKREWFEGSQKIGITAGASAPEVLVRGVIEQLHARGASGAEELLGRPENITFSMPKELRVKAI